MALVCSSKSEPSVWDPDYRCNISSLLSLCRMIAGNKQSLGVFEGDVDQTYAMIKKRSAATKAEREQIAAQGGVEQIQLVAEDPSTTISFNVPDGPPPPSASDIVLDPETFGGREDSVDVEEVHRALTAQWEIYQGFDEKFRKALESGKLENVNKVLGRMSVEEAERVVELLQVSGILQFAEGGIRDETGKDRAEA